MAFDATMRAGIALDIVKCRPKITGEQAVSMAKAICDFAENVGPAKQVYLTPEQRAMVNVMAGPKKAKVKVSSAVSHGAAKPSAAPKKGKRKYTKKSKWWGKKKK